MFGIQLNDYNLPYPGFIGSSIHPIIVHFAIAMVLFSVLFDWLGHFSHRPRLLNVGWYNLIAACAAIVGAIFFGQLEAGLANETLGMRPVLSWHTLIGWGLGAIVLVLAAWRGVMRYRNPDRINPAYLGAGLVVVGMVCYQLFLGTQLVWIYGVHVKPVVEADRQGALR
ncbi:DUF2231 domain-containing protein [Gloeobacter kilaueensis]|uniref:DUF2231 domain-containing protein n=1 Tax=Gloeobacter kilaueensis (strain ATCC BAA-2537 / CCAP 1431/1 / ULC 316 / JS1) TaxID=1183438 RepID=U5QMU8_GLOK1|nr:DUF2231 domain-containing protein [Gloeobacter kilaueensis]AGY58914.1 hypothetical protein GKIL_2668 [Gloeobacter kilaueensis JS1]